MSTVLAYLPVNEMPVKVSGLPAELLDPRGSLVELQIEACDLRDAEDERASAAMAKVIKRCQRACKQYVPVGDQEYWPLCAAGANQARGRLCRLCVMCAVE